MMQLDISDSQFDGLVAHIQERAQTSSDGDAGDGPLAERLAALVESAQALRTASKEYEAHARRLADQLATKERENILKVAGTILYNNGFYLPELPHWSECNRWLASLTDEMWRALERDSAPSTTVSSGVYFSHLAGTREVAGWARPESMYVDVAPLSTNLTTVHPA